MEEMDEYLKDLYKFRQKLNGNQHHNEHKTSREIIKKSVMPTNGHGHSDSDSECSSPDFAKRILRLKKNLENFERNFNKCKLEEKMFKQFCSRFQSSY